MFNVCRRGPASISRVFRAAASTSRIPSTRPSTLSLSLQTSARIPLEARWLHVSTQLRNYAGAAQKDYADGDNHVAAEAPGPAPKPRDVTKFQELIDHDMVHPNIVEEITRKMGHHTMTEVQSMTINQGLQGTDM